MTAGDEQGIRGALRREAARIEEDCLHSAKGHFSAGRIWSNIHFAVGLPAAVMAASASKAAFDNDDITAGVLAIIAAALVAMVTFLNPQARANAHHTAGTRYNSIRNQVRIVREIDMISDKPTEDLTDLVKRLGTERDRLNESSPQIPRWAFLMAKKGIAAGEADYAVDSDERK